MPRPPDVGEPVTMQTLTPVRPRQNDREITAWLATDSGSSGPIVFIAGSLALAVAIIHLQDQGGLLGHQSPDWLKFGYYAIEIGATLTAGMIVRGKTLGWVFALVASAGPFIGYVLSRTVGVPGDPGDIGNWGYTLGTVSLIVEGVLFLVAVATVRRIVRRQGLRLRDE
jgi:hypothetical protein